MNYDKIISAISQGKIIWRKHSLNRMLERNITQDEIVNTILYGEIIKSYETDKPYPSYLVLYKQKSIPIHVLFSFDEINEFIYIITVYYPSKDYYEEDFKMRRKK